MRHDLDARGEASGGAATANGAAPVERKRRKRRSWSVEEKMRVARASFASAETITAVAERHGIPRNRLSSWQTQFRRGQLVAPSSAQAQPDEGFAAVEVEAAPSAVIEGRAVTVRLEGVTDTAGIAAVAWRWQGADDGVDGRSTDRGGDPGCGFSQGS